MSAVEWSPYEARVVQADSGRPFLFVRSGPHALEVFLYPDLVKIVAQAGRLYRARPKREPEMFWLGENGQMTIQPGESLLDAFLRQA